LSQSSPVTHFSSLDREILLWLSLGFAFGSDLVSSGE